MDDPRPLSHLHLCISCRPGRVLLYRGPGAECMPPENGPSPQSLGWRPSPRALTISPYRQGAREGIGWRHKSCHEGQSSRTVCHSGQLLLLESMMTSWVGCMSHPGALSAGPDGQSKRPLQMSLGSLQTTMPWVVELGWYFASLICARYIKTEYIEYIFIYLEKRQQNVGYFN